MNSKARWRWLLTAAVWMCAVPAAATQHLVAPGQDWSWLARRVRPGDEIILMPGRHRATAFDNLAGTSLKPITIRGINPQNPAVITAEKFGLWFTRPKFVILQDVHIENARQYGIRVEDSDRPTGAEPTLTDFRLRRVKVIRTGVEAETGAAMSFTGVRGIRIEDCQIDAWSGAAVELIGCRDVNLDRVRMSGRDLFYQINGVVIRGGSTQVWIRRCLIQDARRSALSIGGASKPEEFRPALEPAGSPRARYEAENVQVENCLLLGSESAVICRNASRVTISNCTIALPALWAFRVQDSDDNNRLGPSRHLTINGNLVVWQSQNLVAPLEIDIGVDQRTIQVAENLWFARRGARPVGSFPVQTSVPQTTDVDPMLDQDWLPANAAAKRFGHADASVLRDVPGENRR